MDPLSLMASVAGVSSAGISLSTALFELISAIRSAPQDIMEIARRVSDLSLVLDQLVVVLRGGEELYQPTLLRSANSSIRSIHDLHEEIWNLVDAGQGNLARVRWVFRRSKTTQLLKKIGAQMVTLQLISTTLLLAVAQRKYSSTSMSTKASNPTAEFEKPVYGARRRLRRQAENLVQSAYQLICEATQPPNEKEREVNSGVEAIDQTTVQPKQIESGRTHEKSIINNHSNNPQASQDQLSNIADGQLVQTRGQPGGTALWLYRIVFDSGSKPEKQSSSHDPETPQDSQVLALRDTQAIKSLVGNTVNPAQVVNNLLWDWTRLNQREIDDPVEEDQAKRPNSKYGSRADAASRASAGSDFRLKAEELNRSRRPHSPLESQREHSDKDGRSRSGHYRDSGAGEHGTFRYERNTDKSQRQRSSRSPRHKGAGTSPSRGGGSGRSKGYNRNLGVKDDDFDHITVEDFEPNGATGSRSRTSARSPLRARSSTNYSNFFSPSLEDNESDEEEKPSSLRNREEATLLDFSTTTHKRDEDERPKSRSSIRTAVVASLVAGAVEALRGAKNPGNWDMAGDKTKRVLAAAAAIAAVESAQLA